jgi:hypothetical protein
MEPQRLLEFEGRRIMKRGTLTRWMPIAAALALVPCGGHQRLAAVDFVRGDVNGDGVLSLADAYFMVRWLARGGPAPECRNASDFYDEGIVFGTGGGRTEVNMIHLSGFTVVEYDIPTVPFPESGPDPTPNSDPTLTCEAYGGGSPLEDPEAELAVLDAVAPGGEDDHVRLTIAISSSTEIVGYYGSILFEGGVAAWVPGRDTGGISGAGVGVLDDLTGTLHEEYLESIHHVRVIGNRMPFGFLNSTVAFEKGWIPPGRNVAVGEIDVCLEKGTRAGTYAMTLEAGELVDGATARAIRPRLSSGTLRVLSDLTSDKGCVKEYVPSVRCNPPQPPEAAFRIAGATALPGQAVALPFKVWSNAPLGGFSFSIDFDEEVLQATDVEQVYRRPDGLDSEFQRIVIDNENATPGSVGVDEGTIAGITVFSFRKADQVLPANMEVEMYRLHFQVKPETTAASTDIAFLDGAGYSPSPGTGLNNVSACGTSWYPQTASSFIFINGRINVVPDISAFVRGDSNGDFEVNLSDAVFTLSFLFLGSTGPNCPDAADANDDGRVDLSDPIATLQALFLGTGPLPEPASPGEDLTPDGLDCRA